MRGGAWLRVRGERHALFHCTHWWSCGNSPGHELFTADKPVLFAYHSYAQDVRGLIYDRPNHDNFHVIGYKEQGSTTTPFDPVC